MATIDDLTKAAIVYDNMQIPISLERQAMRISVGQLLEKLGMSQQIKVQYSTDGNSWHDTFQDTDRWMRISQDGGQTYGERIKISATDGIPGATLYTWIKYSDIASPSKASDIYDLPKATTQYIGLAFNKPTATESEDPADYQWSRMRGEDGNSLTDVGEYYAVGDSATIAPAIGLFVQVPPNDMPKMTKDKPFLWNLEKTYFSNGKEEQTTPALIGSLGDDGVGIKSVTNYYLASKRGSGVTKEDTADEKWTTNAEATQSLFGEDRPYLWNYEVITYTNLRAEETEPHIIGHFGKDGKAVAIEKVENTYAVSADGVQPSDSSFIYNTLNAAISAALTQQSPFIWTLTKTTYSDGKIIAGYSVMRLGTDGKEGQGIPGTSSYLHLAYADNVVWSTKNQPPIVTGFSVEFDENKKFIGQYVDENASDSTDPSRYEWAKYVGDGVTITSTSVRYAKGNANGSQPADALFTYTSIQDIGVAPGDWIWSRTVVEYSDGNSTVTYGAFRIGSDGETGMPGQPGTDGRTPYVHFAYANSADGTTDFNTVYFENAQYIGTCTDFNVADPIDYTRYEWSRLKGTDGKTWRPVLSTDGTLSWQESAVTTPPTPMNIKGKDGTDGKTAIPSLDASGNLSWNYSDGTPTLPSPVNIKGKDGNSYSENLLLNSKGPFTSNTTLYLDRTWGELRGKTITISYEYEFSNVSTGTSMGQTRFGFEQTLALTDGSNSYLGLWYNFGSSLSGQNGKGKAISTTVVREDITEAAQATNRFPFYKQVLSGDVKITNVKIEIGSNPNPVWTPNSSEMISKTFRPSYNPSTGELSFEVSADTSKVTIGDIASRSEVNSRFTSMEVNINLKASQADVTNLNNKVDNLQSGGTNLLPGTKTFKGWGYSSGVIATPNDFEGLTTRTATASDGLELARGNGIVTFEHDTVYTLSFWAKGTAPSFTSYCFPNVNAELLATNTLMPSNRTASDTAVTVYLSPTWKRYYITFRTLTAAQQPTLGSNILFRIHSVGGTASICGVKLEKGNIPSDWSPAPSDLLATDDFTFDKIGGSLSYSDARLTGKPSIPSKIADLSDGAALQTTVNNKANASDVNNALATKANAADVETYLSKTVDLTGLNENLYYPVAFHLPYHQRKSHIKISRGLNAGYGVPSYSSHQNGFSLNVDWETNGEGWGSAYIVRIIHSYSLRLTNGAVAGSIGQINTASTEYIYLRGGSMYDCMASYCDEITLYTTSVVLRGDQTLTAPISSVTVPEITLDTKLPIVDFTWAKIQGKPTTVSGFGLTDVYSKTDVNNALAGKANSTDVTAIKDAGGTPISFNKNDNSGWPTYLLLADVTTWFNSTSGAPATWFKGTLTGIRASGWVSVGDTCMVEAIVGYGQGLYGRRLYSSSNYITPCVVRYNNIVYLALRLTGGSNTISGLIHTNIAATSFTQINSINANGDATGLTILIMGSAMPMQVSTPWGNIESKPTTVAGLGLSDLSISGSVVKIGTASVTVPTNTNQLTNGAGFQTSAQVESAITSKGYATTSSVNSALAGKANIGTVVPMGSLGSCDFNDTPDSGGKWVLQGTGNAPDGSTTNWWQLDQTGDQNKIQRANLINGDTTYYRRKLNNVWTKWVQVPTKAEVEGKLNSDDFTFQNIKGSISYSDSRLTGKPSIPSKIADLSDGAALQTTVNASTERIASIGATAGLAQSTATNAMTKVNKIKVTEIGVTDGDGNYAQFLGVDDKSETNVTYLTLTQDTSVAANLLLTACYGDRDRGYCKGITVSRANAVNGTTSDLRLKEDLRAVDCLAILRELGDVMSFRYLPKADGLNEGVDTSLRHFGLVYQNAAKASIPSFTGLTPNGYGFVNYLTHDYQAILVGAVKQLDSTSRMLKNENESLKSRVTALEKELGEIKSMLSKLMEEK